MKVKELIAQLELFPDDLETDLMEVESLIKKLSEKNCYKNDIYFKHVSEIDLSRRAYNCLIDDGILTIGHLISTDERQLAKISCLGKKTLKEIKSELLKLDLHLGKRLPNDLMQALGIKRIEDSGYFYKTWYIHKIKD